MKAMQRPMTRAQFLRLATRLGLAGAAAGTLSTRFGNFGSVLSIS